jgi:hypothetical protein
MLRETTNVRRGASPPPSTAGPVACSKKLFPGRSGVAISNEPQQPGADGGENQESVNIGDVQVPENLKLRPDQADLNKKLVVRKNATGRTISEWQYRTREVVTMRSKEHAKTRWR